MKNIPQDIKQLDNRLKKLQSDKQSARRGLSEKSFAYAAKTGLRVGTELFSGIVVGGGVGYLLDAFLNTKPWMMVVFLFFGGGAGFLNIYRFAKNEENKKKE